MPYPDHKLLRSSHFIASVGSLLAAAARWCSRLPVVDREQTHARSVLASGVPLLGLLVIALFPVLFSASAAAQYATSGSGLHKSRIFWVDWGNNGDNVFNGTSVVRGFNLGTPATPANRLDVTCKLANATSTAAVKSLRVYTPGSWQGDGLDDLYNIGGFNLGGTNKNAAGVDNPGNVSTNTLSIGLFASAATVEFDFSCSATLGGVSITLPGLVFADAEASGGTEYVGARLTAGGTLRVIDQISLCGTSSTVNRSVIGGVTQVLFNGPTAPQASCESNATASIRSGPVLVGFIDGATSARVLMRAGGNSAVAVGALLEIDYNEAIPASYGIAAHLLSPVWSGGQVSAAVNNNVTGTNFNNPANLGTISYNAPILGTTVAPDADPNGPIGGADVDALPKTTGPLGSGYANVPPPSPVVGSTYTISNVSCLGAGFVAGWIDFNGNGTFDSNERSAIATCSAGASSVSLSWTIPAGYTPQTTSYMRLRVVANASDLTPTGIASDGEVEDYRLTLPAQADMQASVSAPTSALTGQPVTVSGTCTNAGPSAASAPTCALSGLPAGATQTCTPSPVPDPLPLGASINCTSTFTAPATGTLNIIATASSTTPDPLPLNNTATTPVTVIPQADMQATVAGFPATAPAGSTVSGTVTCTNNGPSPSAAPTCAVTTVPAGATVNCLPNPAPNPLAVSASVVCAVSFTVPASGGVTVTGTAGSTTADPIPSNNTAQQSVGSVPQADMAATTTVPSSVAAGQPVTVSGTCTNNGPSSAAAPSCSLSGLPPGATQSCLPNPVPNPLAIGSSVTCTSTFNAPASGPLNITTTAGSSTADPNAGNNVNTRPIAVVPQADMAANVSGFPATAPAGSTVSGTVTCTNNGPSSAASAGCAIGALPAGAVVTCVPPPPVTSLALNATISCAVSFVVPASGVVTVAVTASTTTPDPISANNTASATVTAVPQADMQAVTTVPATATAGQPVTVSGTCSNAGPSTAVAPSCALSGLPPGATQSCVPSPIPNPLALGASVTCSSTFPAPASGTLNITTTVGSTTPDPAPANNVDSQPLSVTPLADMQAVVSGFPATAPAGSTVSGIVTCTNNGPSPAPDATCNVNSLPTGATSVCLPNPVPNPLPVGQSIVCNVSFTAPPGGNVDVTITGTAASSINDPVPANNTSQQSVGIVPIADMQAQTTAPATVIAGQSVTVSGTCTNFGPSIATTPTCKLVGLPPGASQTCAPDPIPATLAAPSGVITCTATFVAPASGTISVSTVAGSLTQDSNPNNNVDTKLITISPRADMVATISGIPATAPAGSTVMGTISCANNGPSAAANATCTVAGLPPGATVVCLPATPLPTLAVGAAITCEVSFVAPATGTVTVVATAASSTTDPDNTNNSAQTPVAVVPQADMRAVTTVPAGGSVTAGQSVSVSGTCTNLGPSPAAAPTCVLSGLPAGATQTCLPSVAPNPLAIGTSIVCSSTFVAPASGPLNITTTAGSTTADPVINNNIDVKPIEIVPQADMRATVTGFPANPNAGYAVTGTVTCTNDGPSAAANATCAVAGVPSGATVVCVPVQPVASLAFGSAIVCSVSFTAPVSGGVTVTGTAGSSTADPVPGNNVAQQSVGVVPLADMVAVTTIPASATAGQPVTVSGTCTNRGPSAAATPTCSLSGLPAGAVQSCSGASDPLPVGAVITCTSTFPAPGNGALSITTTAGSLTADPVPANNVDTRAISPNPVADMQVTLTGFPPNPPAGTTVNGTVTCTNAGPSAAANATCVIAGLPPGATVTCTPDPVPNPLAVGARIVCAVSYVSPPNGAPIITATATSTTPDPITSNNVASTVTSIAAIVPTVPSWLIFVMLLLLGSVAARRAAAVNVRGRR